MIKLIKTKLIFNHFNKSLIFKLINFNLIFQISYLWYSLIGCLGTIAVGVITSYFTGFQDPAELDHDLLSPPIRRLVGVMTSKPKTNSHPLGITNLALEIDDEKPRIEGIIVDKK